MIIEVALVDAEGAGDLGGGDAARPALVEKLAADGENPRAGPGPLGSARRHLSAARHSVAGPPSPVSICVAP